MEKHEGYKILNTLREKVLYILSIQKKGSAGEIAAEITELEGISAEEEVADLTKDISEELEKLHEEGILEEIKEHRQKRRFLFNRGPKAM
jgi:predicted Zn-ribbon and HTH transcriptional regulator